MAKRELRIFIGLNRAVNRIHRLSERVFRRHGLTPGQFAVLEALYHKGDLCIGQVQELILTTSGNIPVIVRNLESQGYLERRQDESDRRRYMLRITPSGRELMDRVWPENEAVILSAVRIWDDEEQASLLRCVRKFAGMED